MSDPAAPGALLVFQRRVVRGTAGALTVGMLVLAVAVPVLVPASTVFDGAVLGAAAATHAAAALTVGRRWEPGGAVCAAYIGAVLLLVGVGVANSIAPDSDAFWFVLVPFGLSALTMRPAVHAALTGAGAGVYVVASVVGPGLLWEHAGPRLVAGVLFAVVMGLLGRRLLRALEDVEQARAALQEQLVAASDANVRLTEVDRARDQFVSTLSHELRTPLASVLGAASTLEGRWERLEDDDRRRLAQVVARNARGLSTVVETMLDLARIEQGGFVPQLVAVDLHALVEDAVLRLSSVLEGHDVQVRVRPGTHVRSDGPLLERVVDNLLTNAARHTPTGTQVTVAAEVDGDDVLVTVADRGPGMEPDVVERLGEWFYNPAVGRTQRRDSIGIGLALVRDVLGALGTTLDVTSAPGAGTSFSWTLPAAAPSGELRS